MAWSYSGDPSTSSKDMVRFKIGDIREDDQRMQDEEINAILFVREDNINYTIVDCFKFLMVKYSSDIDYKIGPESVSSSQLYERYRQLYHDAKGDLRNGNIVPQAPSKVVPVFDKGMMDNGRRW